MSARSPRITSLSFGDLELAVLALPGPSALVSGLTLAEQESARGLCEGLDCREIARRRGSSPHTVKNQLDALYRRLGVRSRHALLARLYRGDDR